MDQATVVVPGPSERKPDRQAPTNGPDTDVAASEDVKDAKEGPAAAPTAQAASAPTSPSGRMAEKQRASSLHEQLGDAQQQELASVRRKAAEAQEKGRGDQAIELLTEALQLLGSSSGGGGGSVRSSSSSQGGAGGSSGQLQGALYAERSQAFASLSKVYRSRPAVRSEYSALYGLDPTHLAQLALGDAVKAVELMPSNPDAHACKGMSLFLLERYHEAEEAYLAGLSLHPSSAPLQAGLQQVTAILTENKSLKRQRSAVERQLDDFECTLCMKLLFEPVTTPCGHTFCRGCYARAMDHSSKCPMCRTVLHCGRQLPVTITLANIISRSFASEYAERQREEREEASEYAAAEAEGSGEGWSSGGATTTLPLFVMSVLLPGEKMSLNIFEPRYRLMIRRAMEGNRRFGMAQVGPGRSVEEVLTEVEITECNPLPDGRYHLEVVGRRRVQLVSTSELDGYRIAVVKPMHDAPEPADAPQDPPLGSLALEMAQVADQILVQLRALSQSNPAAAGRMRHLLSHVGSRPTDAELEGGGGGEVERLSFWMAGLLLTVSPSLHDHHRMELLRMSSSRTRLLWLREHLIGSMPQGGRCSVM